MTRHLDPRIRISLYLAVASVGAALVVWGVVTQDLVDAILPTVAGILAVSGGATAVRNITPAPREEGPSVMEWAMIGRDTVPVILDEIRNLRAVVESQTVDLQEFEAVEGWTIPDPAVVVPAESAVVAAERDRTRIGRHRLEG